MPGEIQSNARLVVEALARCGRSIGREELVDALETFTTVDLGFGTPITFTPSNHQGSKRVWGTRVDEQGQLVEFALGLSAERAGSLPRRP